jgi:hypothetical protein
MPTFQFNDGVDNSTSSPSASVGITDLATGVAFTASTTGNVGGGGFEAYIFHNVGGAGGQIIMSDFANPGPLRWT